MEQDRYYFRVGIFIIIMIAAAFFVLERFVINKNDEIYVPHIIYFKGSVDGLSLGSPVKYKGINVGNVREINFDSSENNLIRVLVDIISTAPIRKNTQASLQLQGITGTSIISLENTSNPEEPVRYYSTKTGKKYLVIPSKKSGFEKVVTSIPALVEEITKLGVQGQKLLSNQNIKTLNLMMNDFLSLLSDGQKTLREIKMLAKTLREDPSQILYGSQYKGYEVSK